MATLQSNSPASFASRWFLAIAAGLLLAGAAHGQTKNSCLECHSILTDNLGVTEEKFSQDIHAQKGLTCASCHGGDATNDDPEIAMGKKAGFKGKITRAQIPQLCGSCHSDPAVMRKYNPSLRTDQLSQYHTSIHGKRLATGDSKSRGLRGLPFRARYPAAKRPAVHGESGERSRYLLSLPF